MYKELIDKDIIITKYKFKLISNNGARFDQKKRNEFIEVLEKYKDKISKFTIDKLLARFDKRKWFGFSGGKKSKKLVKLKHKKTYKKNKKR